MKPSKTDVVVANDASASLVVTSDPTAIETIRAALDMSEFDITEEREQLWRRMRPSIGSTRRRLVYSTEASIRSANPSRHLDALLRTLQGRKKALVEIANRRDTQIEVWMSWRYTAARLGPVLELDQIKSLAELGLSLRIDGVQT